MNPIQTLVEEFIGETDNVTSPGRYNHIMEQRAKLPALTEALGQAFYERFEKEIDNPKYHDKLYENSCPDCGAPYDFAEAAQRAAGITKPTGGEESE